MNREHLWMLVLSFSLLAMGAFLFTTVDGIVGAMSVVVAITTLIITFGSILRRRE